MMITYRPSRIRRRIRCLQEVENAGLTRTAHLRPSKGKRRPNRRASVESKIKRRPRCHRLRLRQHLHHIFI